MFKDGLVVVIPTYNREEVLERAISSVLSQSFSEFSLVIVDDGSTDKTKQLVGSLIEVDSRIHYLYQGNRGVSSARNLAIEKNSKSKWFAFLDSDDEWLPNKLEKQWELLTRDQSLVCHTEEIWIRNGKRVNQMKKHQKYGGWIFDHSLEMCKMSPSSIIIHSDVFDSCGLFSEDYEVCEDYDLWLKITSQFPVSFCEEPLIKKYGGHEDQLSRKFFAMDRWRVKSLDHLLSNYSLGLEQQDKAKAVLLKKLEILIKGYKKRDNITMLADLNKYLEKYQG
ncbi:MAG: glycosyltransferase family 2 protein [Bdellovibrionales bacterium]